MEEQTTEPTTTPDTTDWEMVSQLIATAIQEQQASFETVTAIHGEQWGEFRIIHEATLGDLLVAFFLLSLTSVILLKWLFKVIWGR